MANGDLTVLTPTADQPAGMALCERFMREQVAQPAEWIVVDDGTEAATLAMGQRHVRREREARCTGAESFCRNLLAAIPLVRTRWLAVMEHDDHYAPRHLETLLARLARPGVLMAGDDEQRYYHVGTRQWRIFGNWGSALCQTAMAREVLPAFQRAAQACLAGKWRGVDAALWRLVPPGAWSVERRGTVVGIKGLPGRPGIGIGHRPGAAWARDPDLAMLRAWIGDRADLYGTFYRGREDPRHGS